MDQININKKRVLITGATGFTGIHLVERLAKEDNELVLFVRSKEKTKKIFDKLIRANKIQIIEGSLFDREVLRRAVKDVDIIFHEAAANFTVSAQDPVEDFKITALGTMNILSASLGSQLERFFYPSSILVYGKPTNLPIKEDSPPNPISSYGRSKLSAERYISLFSKTYGIETTIVRFSNMYGPAQVPRIGRGVVADIIDAAISGKPMNVTGDGNRKRSYIFVDDVVDISMLSATKKSTRNEIFNAGTGELLTTNEIIKLVSQLIDKEINVQHLEEMPDQIQSSYPDITKMKKLLDYECKTKFVDGLKKTIEWQTQKTIL